MVLPRNDHTARVVEPYRNSEFAYHIDGGRSRLQRNPRGPQRRRDSKRRSFVRQILQAVTKFANEPTIRPLACHIIPHSH